jgi:CsoR family transcriptional regulator, copper-sensing transcriptional repressor
MNKPARKAHKVDDDGKRQNLVRLKRIEGQVRGIQRMVEEERYCVDILAQVSAVEQALRAVSRELVKNHLRHCAAQALRGPEGEQAHFIDELVDVLVKQR